MPDTSARGERSRETCRRPLALTLRGNGPHIAHHVSYCLLAVKPGCHTGCVVVSDLVLIATIHVARCMRAYTLQPSPQTYTSSRTKPSKSQTSACAQPQGYRTHQSVALRSCNSSRRPGTAVVTSITRPTHSPRSVTVISNSRTYLQPRAAAGSRVYPARIIQHPLTNSSQPTYLSSSNNPTRRKRCITGARRIVPTMVEGHQCHRVGAAHRRLLLGKAFDASSPNGRFIEGGLQYLLL